MTIETARIQQANKIAPHLPTLWLCVAMAQPFIAVMLTPDLDGDISGFAYSFRSLWLASFLPEIIASVFLIRHADFSILQQSKSFWQKADLGFAATFFTIVALHYATTAGVYDSTRAFSWVIHTGFAALCLLQAAGSGEKMHERIATALIAASAAYCLIFLLLFAAAADAVDWVYAPPGFTHIRHLGYFLAPAALIAIARAAHIAAFPQPSVKQLSIYSVAFTLFVFMILWTGSRGGGAATAIAICVGIACNRDMRSRLFMLLLAYCGVVASLFSMLMPLPSSAFGVFRKIAETDLDSGLDVLTTGRTIIWENAAEMIWNKPWLGHGGGGMLNMPGYSLGFPVNHPHSFIFQIPLQWGLIGAAIMTYFALRALLSIAPNIRFVSRFELPSLLAVCGIGALAVIDGTLYYPMTVILFVVLLTGLVRSAGGNQRKIV